MSDTIWTWAFRIALVFCLLGMLSGFGVMASPILDKLMFVALAVVVVCAIRNKRNQTRR